ncbi:transcription factor TGA1-like isoform X2 [Rhodamnia argentea]|uniref:Transcription factor TGA1-like isoform X2 n=2 Tax=Rhodamnia argentea TaxID=178133 RepID=A0ABM3H3F1_9MYRT|nr:transcription factor TGA1-like isoform X2 [Rhodamnia argentea]
MTASMNSPLAQLVNPRKMLIYEPFEQFTMWGDAFKGDKVKNPEASSSMIVHAVDDGLDKKFEYVSHESAENSSSRSDQEANRPDKVQRRLAQNREAARKSRLRKKKYVQQLESSRLKLAQLEQELGRARQQGVFLGNVLDANHFGFSRTVNSGIATFEMEYAHWVNEQHKKSCELRTALQGHVGDVELLFLVESGLKHYFDLFGMKAEAAKADVFFLMSGAWRTSAERFFLWIGGFRPSELLNVLVPQIDLLTEQQMLQVCNLRHLSQQAEDALSKGLEKLQQNLAQEVADDQLGAGNYASGVDAAMEKLEALENFVNQADHLRQQTMQQMSRILTTRQAARALLVLGEFCHRLRALSSLWAARPPEPA